MRVVTKMMTNTYLRDLYKNNAAYMKYSTQIASGDRMQRASDDPIGTVQSITVRTEQAQMEQYQSNLGQANGILTETESCVSEINDIVQRMEELVGIGASGLMSTDDKANAAQEIYQLRDELVNIGNTVYNGQYIFGGYNTTKPPFEADGNGGITFNGIDLTTDSDALKDAASEVIEYKIGTSSNFPTTINGAALFGTGKDNLYSMLNNLADLMSNSEGAMDEITTYSQKISDALEHNLSVWTDVGARSSRVALVKERFETNYQNLEEKRSDIEDIDEEKTITNYKFAYAAYEAALQVGAQIMQQSLLDYLS